MTLAEGPLHRFLQKLRRGADLSPEDEAAVLAIPAALRAAPPRRDIVAEGDDPRALYIVLEGWACGYRVLENGKRQITSILLPGDLTQPFGLVAGFADHSIAAITAVTLAEVSASLRQLCKSSPRLDAALWWDLLVTMATDRERNVSLGRRSAVERLGHLFCELHQRLTTAGMISGPHYDMPLTQIDMADALGLSSVHVNRSLQDLRTAGLIDLHGRQLVIHDLARLHALSLFDLAYLHAEARRLPSVHAFPRSAEGLQT